MIGHISKLDIMTMLMIKVQSFVNIKEIIGVLIMVASLKNNHHPLVSLLQFIISFSSVLMSFLLYIQTILVLMHAQNTVK